MRDRQLCAIEVIRNSKKGPTTQISRITGIVQRKLYEDKTFAGAQMLEQFVFNVQLVLYNTERPYQREGSICRTQGLDVLNRFFLGLQSKMG